ncbi:MAG: signal peptidase I [Campylobacteraceae bacterium]|jgi:signal peptidase I|nr:signal peptidase I [Campylobacteraceae bacterium]
MKRFFTKLYNFASSWTGTIIIVLVIIFFVAQAFIIPSASMQNSLLIGDFLFAKKFSYGIAIPRIPFSNTPVFPDIFDNGHIIEGKRPQRGDIVIFLNPLNDKENYVKRCFAVGGDEVIYKDDSFYLHHNEGDEYIQKNYPADEIIEILGKLWVKNPYAKTYPGINYKPDAKTMMNMIAWENNPWHRGRKIAMSKIFADELESFAYASQRVSIPYSNPYNPNEIKTVIIDIPNFNAFYVKIPQDEFFMIGDNRDNSQDSRFFGSIPYKLIVGEPWFIYFSWDSDKVPRWNRVGKSISALEKEENKNIRY